VPANNVKPVLPSTAAQRDSEYSSLPAASNNKPVYDSVRDAAAGGGYDAVNYSLLPPPPKPLALLNNHYDKPGDKFE
jgi:hypothetical protein